MDRLKRWRWENFWMVWSVIALFVGPTLTAALSVPHVMHFYSHVPTRALLATVFVGAIAGTSGFLYSRSVPAIGFGLATAFDSGSGLVVGSIIPLFKTQTLSSNLASNILSIAAVAVGIVGIFFSAKAGKVREATLSKEDVSGRLSKTQMTFFKGVAFSIVAGSIASCMNLGLVFQGDIAGTARAAGASGFGISSAFLAPYLFGGFLSNILYAGVLVKRNRALPLFRLPGTGSDWFWSMSMGLFFALAIAAYSGAIARLGEFGTVVGWGLKTAVAIAISSIWDLQRGEWSTRGKSLMLVGVGILIVAVVLLGTAQSLFVSSPSR
jgi:L-rhamnose-H+ transport protein